jgi:membrane protease YdiL (CAAX protease family)
MQNIPSKKLIIVQIFLIFILPVFLIYFNILPISWRIALLATCALVVYGIIRKENWTFEDLGLHVNNLKKSLPYYATFTFLGVMVLFIISQFVNLPEVNTKIFFIRTFAFFIPISFFQEFTFRVFLIPRLKLLYNNNLFIITINAVLFMLLHIIFPNWEIGLPLTFFSGIFFAWLYIKYPNLVLVSISHIILNITAVLLGFFVIN